MTTDVKVHESIPAEYRRQVADAIIQEHRDRKDRRKDLEKHWREVDRQLRMEPERSHKLDAKGHAVAGLEWLPETETPLQSQSLEMLMADSRRLKFPKNRDWFSVRAALDDKYIERYANAGSPIPGEKAPNYTELRQDDADRIAAAIIAHWHSKYDFRASMDIIDAGAFKYGFGVGRLRPVRRRILGLSARSGPSEEVIPVLVPRDPKSVFLDDSQHAVMHEGEVVGPNQIQHRSRKLADVIASAESDDSYMKDQVGLLVADKDGLIEVIELEGDLVVDVGDRVLVVRNVVATAAAGSKDGNETIGLIRVEKGEGFSTYYVSHYQQEMVDSAYGTSPLIKGMPVAKVIAQILNRLMESASLKNAPPVGYNRDDPAFAINGGPRIIPYEKWESTDKIEVYDKVGGDPSALFAIYQGLLSQYYDVVGVTPARLGAQTKSHTTAYAKDVEMNRGVSRTVDYVNGSLEGPMTRLLDLEYRMGIKKWRKGIVYIQPWNEFAELERAHLPDIVHFIASGTGNPAEEESRQQQKFAAAQTAIQLDLLRVQQGQPATIDVQALIQSILEDGGWVDTGQIMVQQPADAGQAEQGQLPGVASAPPEPLV